ncbi:MAG: hypothetical protein HC821_01255 [Lewinella sp.]|nr:hypothetical protein [Lewinella sp.]
MPILSILTLLVVLGLLFLFNTYAKNRLPSRSKRPAVVAELRADLGTWMDDLIPLDKKELDLFSLGQSKQIRKNGISPAAKGIFTTIFEEPVVAYSYRQFLGGTENELLLVRTNEHEYVYWSEKGEVELQIDEQLVGKLKNNVLYGQRTGQELARIAAEPRQNYLPVKVGAREVGALTVAKAPKKDALAQRAFEFIPEDLSEQEEQLFLALTTLILVRQSLTA